MSQAIRVEHGFTEEHGFGTRDHGIATDGHGSDTMNGGSAVESGTAGTVFHRRTSPVAYDPAVAQVESVVQLSVMLFASYADAFRRDRLQVDLADGAVVGDLVEALRARPEGGLLPPRPMVAVNRRHADYSASLQADDEVALIPPVAGG